MEVGFQTFCQQYRMLYSCLAEPSAAAGCSSYWCAPSQKVIIHILNHKYRARFILSDWICLLSSFIIISNIMINGMF